MKYRALSVVIRLLAAVVMSFAAGLAMGSDRPHGWLLVSAIAFTISACMAAFDGTTS